MYFITIGGFFSIAIDYLTESDENRILLSINDDYLSILDEYLFYDLVENVESFYDLNTGVDNIIVYVDNSEVSKCQLLLLQYMFPSSNKIAICLDKDNIDIINLCDKLNFKYYNKMTEYVDSEFKHIKDFMIYYCKLCDIKYCFMNIDNNEVVGIIFDSIFDNHYVENVNNIDKSEEEGGIIVYNLFSNPKFFLNYVNLWDNHFGIVSNNYTDNFYYHRDLINDNWRTNLVLTYNQLKKEDNDLSSKIRYIFDDCEFKHGVIINLDNKKLPYWLWENIFSQYCDNFNLEVEKQVIQTLYFTITQNKKDDGEILLDWRYNYNNGVFILYNHTELQNLLNTFNQIDSNKFEINNSIESFLKGQLIYEVLDDSSDDYLNFHQVNLNLEDTNNEDIFTNFKFKKFNVNTIVKNTF